MKKVIFYFILFLVLSIVYVNYKIEKDVKKAIPNAVPSPAPSLPVDDRKTEKVKEISKKDLPLDKEVTRRTRVERGSDIIEHVFYQNAQEIAHQKIYPNGRIEQTGIIPDGKVKFYDEYQGSHGEEHYLSGKKSGPEKTYYSNGRVKSEGQYRNGKSVTLKEYYKNGNVRFDVDYSDARNDIEGKEVGIGKLYYPNGTLKYEWNLTASNRKGHRKSYNRDGQLRAEFYYDQYGNLIER